jgi:hypothetical protein
MSLMENLCNAGRAIRTWLHRFCPVCEDVKHRLKGHRHSKLDGENGLAAATMRAWDQEWGDGDAGAMLQRELRSVVRRVESTSLSALLEFRHETLLQWCEPWPACGPEGNDLDAHIILRATIHDCINMQRRVAKEAGRSTMGGDRGHLLDFMASHWARFVEQNTEVSDCAS